MKATLWLCSVVTAMLTQSIYATPLIHYQYSKPSKSLYKENVLTEMKRTKPSLSIVNPLDVLRQRLLLEIARRHMQENSRQVEKNRMILKTVGKRSEDMDGDEAGAEFADWQRMRLMPQLKPQSHGWPRIHRSGYQRPLSAYDVFQEMDLRNHRSINRQLNAVNDMELDPNRSDAPGAAAVAAEEEQSPLADYGEEDKNNQSSGLNI